MKSLRFLAPIVAAFSLALVLGGGHAHAADYNNSHLMDDQVFDNVGSLSQSQIDDFLHARTGPFTKLSTASPCLSGYNDINFRWDGSDWYYGDNTRVGNSTGWVSQGYTWNTAWGPNTIPASQIIYKSAQMWGFNSEVLISTLQKEESLITGTSCDAWRYNSAMGYGCPDSGGCNAKYAGFSRQVLWGGWQLKFGKERSYGNTAWDDDGSITYGGFMTQGNRRRCTSCALNFYDGYATIDGQSIYLENGTTASLYTYTPHLGQSFPGIFEGWFGSVIWPSYAWQFASQGAYTDSSKTTPLDISNVEPGQTGWLIVRAKNVGTGTWVNSGANPARLGTDRPADRASSFATNTWIAPWRTSNMTETSVAPGQIGTFEFPFKAPAVNGTFNEYFNPLIEGIARMNNDQGQFFPITVKGQFAWQFASQGAYTDSSKTTPLDISKLSAGQTAWLLVRAQNTGNSTWHNSGSYPVRIGTDRPNERPSRFATAAWLSPSRPASMTEATVAPGQTGTFEFPITVPAGGGLYREYFNLLAENYTWFNSDVGQFFPMTIVSNYSWSYVSQASYTDSSKSTPLDLSNLSANQTGWLVVRAQNTGNATWFKNGNYPARLGTDRPQDRSSAFATNAWIAPWRPTTMTETSVAPGQTGTFEFPIKAPANAGTYKEYFNPLIEQITWLNNNIGQFFPMTVH